LRRGKYGNKKTGTDVSKEYSQSVLVLKRAAENNRKQLQTIIKPSFCVWQDPDPVPERRLRQASSRHMTFLLSAAWFPI